MTIPHIVNRALLCSSLALASVATAEAGTYTATLQWDGTPTITGVATAGFSGMTASWDIEDGLEALKGTYYSDSKVIGVAKWKITWSSSYAGEIPPTSCDVLVAKQLSQSAGVEVSCTSLLYGNWAATANSSDIIGEELDVSKYIAAHSTGYQSDEKGSSTPTHKGYYDFSGTSFTSDGSGHYVSYVVGDISAETQVQVTGGASGRSVAYDCYSTAGASVHGKLRLVIVNNVQIGNDFSGGLYATSGYSN